MSEANDPNDSDRIDIGSDDDIRLGDEPIEGDGVYPFAGLTRYDDDVEARTLPENVWTQQSSMRYWAANEVAHEIGDDVGVEDDLDASVLPERGLHTMIHDLPSATDWPVFVQNPRTGEVMRTLKSQAIMNRRKMEDIEWGYGNAAEVAADLFGDEEGFTEREVADAITKRYAGNADRPVVNALSEFLDDEQLAEVADVTTLDDALFAIPTQSYTIINPPAFLGPLCEVIRDQELSDKVFGEIRLGRNEGRATLDLFFDGKHVDCPIFEDDREPIVVGLEIQWDFYGDWSVRARGTGFDWRCTNRIHRLTDTEIVKHSGDVESRQDWYEMWEELLAGVDEKTDQLSQVIQIASEAELDFSELPEDIDDLVPDRIDDARPWAALYYYAGLPSYLAEHAGRSLRAEADDPYNPTMWEMHSAATDAVTHEARSERTAGGAYDDYANVANDFLFNPGQMQETIQNRYEMDRVEDDQDTLADENGGVVQIETAFESVQEKKEQFEEWQEEIAQLAPGGTGDDGGE